MKTNKLFLLMSAALMTFSITSCGGAEDDESDDIFTTDSNGEIVINSDKDGQAYCEKNDEDVKSITVFKNDWADFNNARKSNTPVYSKIKENVGVDIEALNSSGSTWESQLSLLQADEDLPDIFLTNGPDNSYFFEKLIRNEDILPISDWVSEEHYPNIYNYLKQFNYMRNNITYADGKMWYIPSSWHNEKSLYVRTDWIENLNNKLDDILVKEGVVASKTEITEEIREQYKYKNPDTLLEFYRLARAFTLYDPDNNGQNDTCGYMSESNKDMDSWIYVAFDTGWGQWVSDGEGGYIHSDVTDGSKYATAFITRLISEGYMSKDSLTADNETKQNRFANGKAGMMYAHNWYDVIISGLMAASGCTIDEARQKVGIIAPPAGKNGTFGGGGADGSWQGFCINANMSNARIRKCLEFYDYLLSDEGYNLLQYGIEGVNYTKNADGSYNNLLPRDEDGFVPYITSVDPATLLYALVDWTMNYRSELLTSASIVNPRQRESEKQSCFSDYPDVTTSKFVESYDAAHNLFEEMITTLEKNEKNLFYEPKDSESYNPTTFGWDDLYNLDRSFNNKWASFTKSYLSEAYGGQEFIDEYNEYIKSGKAKKVTMADYIFR